MNNDLIMLVPGKNTQLFYEWDSLALRPSLFPAKMIGRRFSLICADCFRFIGNFCNKKIFQKAAFIRINFRPKEKVAGRSRLIQKL